MRAKSGRRKAKRVVDHAAGGAGPFRAVSSGVIDLVLDPARPLKATCMKHLLAPGVVIRTSVPKFNCNWP